MYPDIDPVQKIDQAFSKPYNHEPHTSLLQTQMRFVTPLSIDLDPEITKPTSRNIFVSADLDPDIDHFQIIARVFSESSNLEPHTSRL